VRPEACAVQGVKQHVLQKLILPVYREFGSSRSINFDCGNDSNRTKLATGKVTTMSVLKRSLSLFTGNALSQKVLEYNVKVSHYLMGVGCGTKVHTSGEMALVRLVDETHNRPCRVFDVGANVGQFAGLITGNCRTAELEIHSFEPSRQAFDQLALRFGDDDRVTLNNFALGSDFGKATLYSDTPASGLSSLTRRDLAHVGRSMDLSQTVKVRTLDSYCEEHGIDRIDLLKIDVEGHERDVLAGASRMFEEQRVDAVTFEFGGCNIDTGIFMRELYYFFRDRDMDIYRITPRGYLRHLERYRESLEQFVTTNYLAQKRAAA